MKNTLLTIAISAFFIMTPQVYADELSAAKKAIKVAKIEKKKAARVGFEWRDVGKFIKEAEAALEKGDKKTAIKLANKAKFQALLGQQQAKDQANAGPNF